MSWMAFGVRVCHAADHVHGHSIGRDLTGGFYARRLQAYPSDFCRKLAELVGDTLQHFLVHHQGPTGALSRAGDRPIPRTRPVSGNKGC